MNSRPLPPPPTFCSAHRRAGAISSYPAASKKRQRFAVRARAVALAWGVTTLLAGGVSANTPLAVPNGTTDLTTLGATTSSDLEFTNITYAPNAFTAATALSIGTLDDLDATQTLGISGAGTITLNGGSNSVAPNTGDLLYVVNGGTLNVGNNIVLGASGNFDVVGTASLGGVVSGSQDFTKMGAGTLTLSGANTFSGMTSISAGLVTLNNSLALQNSTLNLVAGAGSSNFAAGNSSMYTLGGLMGTGGLYLAGQNNAAITLTIGTNNSSNLYSGALTNAGTGNSALVVAGTGTQIFTGASSYTGTTTINSGATLQLGTGSAQGTLGTGSTGVIDNGTLVFNNNTYHSQSGYYLGSAGVISGTGGLTVTGTSGVGINVNNTYSGTTTITTGTVLYLGGNGSGNTTGSIANSAVADSGTLTVNRTNAAVQGSDFGAISGVGAFTQSGTGATTLNAANRYSGATTISAGSGTLTLSGSLSGSSVTNNNVFTETATGVIAGAGAAFTQAAGTATLGGANTFTGATTVTGGALVLSNALAIQNSTLSGAVTFDQSVTGNAFTIGGLTGSTNQTLANNAATPAAVALTFGGNNATNTYSGVLSGAGSVIKVGTGTQTYSAVNTYTGTTVVNGGTLTLVNGGTAGGSLSGTPSITVNNGGTLNLTASDTLGYTTSKEALTINSGGTVENTGTGTRNTLINTVTMTGGTLTGSAGSGDANGSFSFDASNGGLTATSDASGNAALVNVPKVSLQSPSTTFNVTRGSAAPTVDVNISSVIAAFNGNVYTLTKTGNGVLQLNGVNTFLGGLTINGGVVDAHVTNALGTISGVSVANGAEFSVTAANTLATPGATTSTTTGSPASVAGQIPISLGGTLLRNGIGVSLGSQSGTAGTVGIGLLTLTANSTLDFGTSGVGTLNLNSFAPGSSILNILDYTRTTANTAVGVDGTDDRLIFNQNIAAAGTLGDITFNGGAAQQLALGNGEYEILPAVPEPSTWVGGLGTMCLLGSVVWRSRRRTGQPMA